MTPTVKQANVNDDNDIHFTAAAAVI